MAELRLSATADREAPEGHRWYRLVTPRIDDHGTVILPEGGDLERHRANPLWLWMHSSGPRRTAPQVPTPQAVIGRVERYDQTPEALDVLVRFDVEDPVGQLVYRKTRDGFLRACSVGFDPAPDQPVMRQPETEEQAAAWGVPMGAKVPVFERWSLREGSSVILGSNEEALALLRALPDRDRPEPAVRATTFPETFPAEERKTMKTTMKPEHRWICRGIIGAHMNTAEGHLRAMEHAGDGHMQIHKDAATREMEGAEAMARMMREAGDSDDDMMRKARRHQARSAPATAPDDLRTRFNKLAEEIKALDVVDAGDVLRSTLETDDPEKADARICALQATQERFKLLRAEVEQTREDAFAAEREKEVSALLDARLMTPAQGKRAREERWSLARIGEFRAEAEKAGPVIDIVRQRPLNPVQAPAPGATPAQGAGGTPAGSTTPAAPQPRERGQGGVGGRRVEVEETIRALAERTGLNPDRLMATYVKWERGEGKVGFDTNVTHV